MANATESTWTGTTRIEGGTLALGDSDVIGDGSDLDMAGGTFMTGGFNETFDNLTLNGSSTVDMGGSSDITFAGTTGATFNSGVLSIHNWNGALDTASAAGGRRLIFDTQFNAGAFTDVIFYSDGGATQMGTGAILIDIGGGFWELVPTVAAVPEPSTWLGGCALRCSALPCCGTSTDPAFFQMRPSIHAIYHHHIHVRQYFLDHLVIVSDPLC